MSPTYKRWYDHDPLLLEVIDLLRNYQTELKAQAEIFLKKKKIQLRKYPSNNLLIFISPKTRKNILHLIWVQNIFYYTYSIFLIFEIWTFVFYAHFF